MLRTLVPLAPPLAAGLALALLLPRQPADELGAPESAGWLHPVFYDDYDFTAWALRALNAEAGRRPGRLREPEELTPDEFAHRLRDPSLPLADRYYLEYPHATLLLFRLGFVWQGPPPPPPPAFLDAYYPNILWHTPAEDERPLYRRLRWALRTYTVLMAACYVALSLVLAAGYERGGGLSAGWGLLLLVLPSALFYSLYRFDVVPALLTAAAFACLGRGRPATSGALFGAAALVKVYPVLLVPLVLRYLGQPRAAARWGLGFAATAALLAVPPLFADGLEGFLGPYKVQFGRKVGDGSVYRLLLPEALGGSGPVGQAFRLGALALTLGLLLLRRPAGLPGLLRRCAVVLVVFMLLAVFVSQQWNVWLLPLLLPLVGGRGPVWARALLAALLVALDLASYFTFPYPAPGVWYTVLFCVRLALLAAVAALMLRWEWADRPAPHGAGGAGGD